MLIGPYCFLSPLFTIIYTTVYFVVLGLSLININLLMSV